MSMIMRVIAFGILFFAIGTLASVLPYYMQLKPTPAAEEMIQLGYGKEVAKSKAEKYAREQGVSYERALYMLHVAAELNAAGEEIRKNPWKYGVPP